MSAATYLTNEDVQNYGSDLLDVTQRAALDAVTPALQHLEQQNAQLQRRLAIEARRNLDQAVERQVPNFREVDRDPRWHSWLMGVDTLTGRARQVLLNDAIASTDAGRVAAFFAKFQSEVGATQTSSAHPERTRSAPSGRQIYTREMIGQLYERRRKGEFADADWGRIEADIFRAQRENRIRGPDYLTK